jgi:hypothetical protein
MFKFIFYLFSIIYIILLFNFVSSAPGQNVSSENDVQLYTTGGFENNSDDDYMDDDSTEPQNSTIITRKSNGLRAVSINISSFLLIGVILFAIRSLHFF